MERGVAPESLVIDETQVEDETASPITVTLRQLSDEEATPKQQVSGGKVNDGLFRSNLMDEEDEHSSIRQNASQSGTSETIHAKYVIGCDGARSWTRKALGYELEGEATDFIWGVMDVIPITDFRKPILLL